MVSQRRVLLAFRSRDEKLSSFDVAKRCDDVPGNVRRPLRLLAGHGDLVRAGQDKSRQKGTGGAPRQLYSLGGGE